MFEAEAVRLREILLAQQVPSLLNIGSSTGAFRTLAKPYIERELFAPLRAAGVEIVHSDLKQAEGVDVAGDILDPALIDELKARGFKCVLLSNLLEHVRDRAAVIAACETIAGPKGLILATVPCSYPFHADPIDTGYRPTPAALAAAFTRSRPLLCEEVVGHTYRQDIAARDTTILRELAATAKFAVIAPLRPGSARSRLHRWRWFSRPYRVSVVLVETAP